MTMIVVLAAWAAHCAAAGADVLAPQIHTVAGAGSCSGAVTSGGHCDGVSATSVPISSARSVAALPGGGFLYIDAGNDLVREVTPVGTVFTVAGNGTAVDAPDGTLAVSSGLDDPVAVAPLPGGGFLVTEYDSSVVRMVSPGTPATATITTIAGTGSPGHNGLAGAATAIALDYPTDAQPTATGGVLIADTFNNEVRLVSAAAVGATLSTIAGGGACDDLASSCDGLAATAVRLDHPDSVSPLQDGSGGYLVAEYGSDAVRKVSAASPSGTFTTVAGIPGDAGYSGDGGPARTAQLNNPEQVLSTADGGFLIADTGNEVIRRVLPSGTISTIAGNGVATYSGDDAAATAASLFTPASIAVASDGDGGILVADEDNNRIREITLAPDVTITLSPAAPNGSDGWYVTPVTASVTTDEGATLYCELDPAQAPPAFAAFVPGCPFAGTGGQITGNGTHTVYAAGENLLGDDSLPVSASVNIDVSPPTITCATPPSFVFGTAGAQVTATLSDGVSGPAAQTLAVPADTSALGTGTVRVDGANDAGISTVTTCPYTVTPLILQPVPATSWAFRAGRAYTTVASLVVDHVPAQASVAVACDGHGCPFATRRASAGACGRGACVRAGAPPRRVSLTALFAHRRLAPGTRLTVSVTAPDAIGRIALFTIRAGRGPAVLATCLTPGSLVTRQRC